MVLNCVLVGCPAVCRMFTLYRTAIAPARKPYRMGRLFTHKNRDFGAISVTERSCDAQISKVRLHISDRFGATLRCTVNWFSDSSGGEEVLVRTGIRFHESKYSGVKTGNLLGQPLRHMFDMCERLVPVLCGYCYYYNRQLIVPAGKAI